MRGRPTSHPILAVSLAAMVSLPFLGGRPVSASEFSDFRIPENRWLVLRTGIQAGGRFDRTQAPDRSLRNSSLSGDYSLDGEWGCDADDRLYSLGVSSSISARGDHEEFSRNFPFHTGFSYPYRQTEDVRDRSMVGRLTFAGGYRRHLFGLPLSLGISVDGELFDVRSTRDSDERQWFADSAGILRREQARAFESHRWRRKLSGGATIGWGRVRNATGIFDAAVLERRLRKAGVLVGPLSRATRVRIAQLYYLRSRYALVHDRPDRFFWRDLEGILREDGALEDRGWAAFDLFRADESYVTMPGSALRRKGLYVGAIYRAAEDHNRYNDERMARLRDYRNDTLVVDALEESHPRSKWANQAIVAGAEAEIHAPLGLRWQVRVTSRVSTPNRNFGKVFDAISEGVATYSVADRWGIETIASHRRNTRAFGVSSWETGYQVSLQYYAEDRLTFSLGASAGESLTRSAPERYYARRSQIWLGLAYRFLGAFDAPGLIDPVRSLSLSGAERGW